MRERERSVSGAFNAGGWFLSPVRTDRCSVFALSLQPQNPTLFERCSGDRDRSTCSVASRSILKLIVAQPNSRIFKLRFVHEQTTLAT